MKYIGENALQRICSLINGVVGSKADKSNISKLVLFSKGWTFVDGHYEQPITFRATETALEVMIGVVTDEQALACAEAQILRVEEVFNAGSRQGLIFHAYGDKPSIDIPIVVIIRGDL